MPTEPQLALWQQDRRSLDGRYVEWRRSDDGIEVVQLIEEQALNAARAGEMRIEINLLWAQVRRVRRKAADNSFRALLARELIDKHPQLRGVIRVKKRAEGSA
jgi:hypothetical protein